jgi:hypothetical protein
MRAASRLLSALALSALVAGCAGPWRMGQLSAGTPRDAVLASLGTPTRSVRLPDGGERLQYSLQPFGQQAWMVDLDAGGRLVRSRQVMTANDFHRIVPGQWTRADVEREFGPPGTVDRVASWNGPILTYRWNDGADMFYWIYLDGADVVRRAHPGMEFRNVPERD